MGTEQVATWTIQVLFKKKSIKQQLTTKPQMESSDRAVEELNKSESWTIWEVETAITGMGIF